MKKILVFAGILIILAATRYSICSIRPDRTKLLKTQSSRAITFQEAKTELVGLLTQREKFRAMKQKTLFKLKKATSGKYAAGGMLLQLREQLRMIRNIERLLINRIAQLMKQHPELMKYLPSNVGFLPIMPFLPVAPIRPPVMPRLWMP